MRLATGCLAALLLAACGTTVSTRFSEVGGPEVAIPAACEAAIAEFLVAVEPIVRDIDFAEVSDAEAEALGRATIPAAEEFDPDACPDFEPEHARAAWLQVAEQRAPGTIDYVEYTYATD